ncbi:MAG: hypothetical protein ABH879_03130 [archaeon]
MLKLELGRMDYHRDVSWVLDETGNRSAHRERGDWTMAEHRFRVIGYVHRIPGEQGYEYSRDPQVGCSPIVLTTRVFISERRVLSIDEHFELDL